MENESTAILIKENAYLYSLWSGQFKKYKGNVYRSRYNKNNIAFNNGHKNMQCCESPGIVCNAVVWLEEDDENKARSILINYELSQIEKLKDKIANHEYKILILRGENTNE